ncbi:MAG: sortase [Actinomycetota bacterium]|nr:sortase [Actinomycetota bacterium]
MLLRVGVISMSFSLLVALVVAAVILLRGPEEKAAAEPVAAKSESSESLESVSREISSRESADLPVEPEPEPEQRPAVAPQRESAALPESALQPEPEPQTESASEPEPALDPNPQPQNSLPVAEEGWPKPSDDELAAANGPRRYGWVSGAIMTLTVDGMGIYNAPVMKTDSQQALDNGIVHVPETSLPWTRSPHRNVYLAAPVLGWPSTGSRLIFYNLHRLGSGDEVILKDRQGNRYRYKVTEKFVVNPNDRWVMGQELNRDMVTLQTCTGPYFSKRLIVRADRV